MTLVEKNKKRSIRTSVVLTNLQYEYIAEVARIGDLSVAWVIRQAVQQFVERGEFEHLLSGGKAQDESCDE